MSYPAAVPVEIPARFSDRKPAVPRRTIPKFDVLKPLYTFKNSFEVEKFLLQYKDLIPYIIETHKQVQKIFGKNALEIRLEYAGDPEEDYDGLFAIVKTNLPAKESLDLLDKFDEEWFLENVSREVGLQFTVEVESL